MNIKKSTTATILVMLLFSLLSATSTAVNGFPYSTKAISTSQVTLDDFADTYSMEVGDNHAYGVYPFNFTGSRPIATPIIRTNADGEKYMDFGSQDWDNHWWIIDYWTSWGYGLPSYMNGEFVAVENTIGGLSEGDALLYLPLNVCYGTSSSDCVWFQFDIEFNHNGEVNWYIWDIRSPAGEGDFHYQVVDLPYTEGHIYEFELMPSGVDTITFTITDTNTYDSWSTDTWQWDIPSLDMIYVENMFSPASAVEGYTTNSQLTNVPYFMTYVGYEVPAHSHTTYGSVPSGVNTKVWYDYGYYFWSMLSGYYYMTTATGSVYGSGYVLNPSYVTGSSPDDNWAEIYGPNRYDGGNIAGEMNNIAGGLVYVYARTYPGYASNLLVYGSYDGQNYYQIGTTRIVTYTTGTWIAIGTAYYGFKYMAITSYNAGNPTRLFIDAVKVIC